MKIVINAASARMGGAVNYITHLLRELSDAEADLQVVVFLPQETAAKLGELSSRIRVLPTTIGCASLLKRLWWEQVSLRRFVRKEKPDVLFSSANFGMFGCPAGQILLVRNTLYFSNIYRKMFLRRHRWKARVEFELRRWLIALSAKGADVVMTPTRAMLDELRQFVRVRNAVVNPYGVSAPQVTDGSEDDSPLRSDGAGNCEFRLLYVSLYSEHKNLGALLKALPLANAKGRARFKLKTTADPAWSGAAWTVTHREDLKLAQQPGIAGNVEFAGPLGHEAVQHLYRSSDMFVFPSLTESFGFPMAEAMAHGLPIVAADTPVNREICGDAAVYFSPLSTADLANRLHELASDASLRLRLRRKGSERAACRFCWDAHAAQLLRVAREISEGREEKLRGIEPVAWRVD